ncbi:MAG: hypothetical protein JRI68_20065 [Deltaproteobacteria bacterium]|nr:hypothetical protein [Deltaproteobacteria bacterium]
MNADIASAIAVTSTGATPSYRPSPRLVLLAREDPGSGYRAGDSAGDRPARTPPPPANEPETVSDWGQVHARIVELGAERAAHERDLCRWLLAAERLGVHARAGYASLREYVGRLVGLTGRQTEERLRVGRALAALPLLDRALAEGGLCFSAMRELSRVATADTEQEWLDWAGGKTSREIERAVVARRPGDGPRDRADPSLVTHRLRFEVRAETMALFRDLQATVQRDLGGQVDDDTLLYEIARRALGGPDEEGRSSYQVALTRCEACGQTSIDAGGQSHPVDSAVAEMAACDSQQLGAVDGSEGDRGDEGGRGDEGDCGDPASSPHAGAHDSAREAAPEPPYPAPSCPPVGAKAAAGVLPRRASQTVPRATRRAVLRRDRQRCSAPGCNNHLFLDVHHLDPRAEGGSHDPDRMATLCGSHHRNAHAGSLCIDGNATNGFNFRHADGTPYGQSLRPATVERVQQAVATLRHLGFGANRARALLDAVVGAGAPDDLEGLVRAALQAS